MYFTALRRNEFSRFLPALVTLLAGCQTPGIVGQVQHATLPLIARGSGADEPADGPLEPTLLPVLVPPQPAPDPVLGPAAWLSLTPPGSEPLTLERGLLLTNQQNDLEAGTWTAKMAIQQVSSGQRWENPLLRPNWQTDEALRCTLSGPFFLFGQMGASSEEALTTDFKVTGRTGLACNAIPALTPQDRDKINQDVRLAFPVGETGKLQMGARHHWENTQDSRPLPDSLQIYLGFQLTR
jgi:hypothetical protein